MGIDELEAELGIEVYQGTILGFGGSWGSGLGFLRVEDEQGVAQDIPCDNGPTVRALDAAFGGVIGEGHCVDNGALAGQQIAWWYDEIGLVLGGFMPL